MSCYEWEQGTIKLPSKDWAKFRTEMLKAWNAKELARLEKAKVAHKALTDACKGKRGSERAEALKSAVTARFTRLNRVDELYPEIRDMVVTVDGWGHDAIYTLKALPKKKDLKLFATSKDAEMYCDDGYVAFKNATRSLVWSVSENNHAREHAHEHWFAKLVFAALRRITWTRGSGGKIVGNDEYNRDSDNEDGGGNYVTMAFSATEQKRQRQRVVRHQPRYY